MTPTLVPPISDADIAMALSDPDELLRQVTATDRTLPSSTALAPPKRRIARGPLVASAALGATVVTAAGVSLAVSGSGSGSTTPQPNLHLAALSFHVDGDEIDVRVQDPNADPARFRQELAAHHLDIDLRLVPASPSLVGTVVFEEDDPAPGDGYLEPITAAGCGDLGSGTCTVGVRVPVGYQGHAAIVFGRAAKPGETVSAVDSENTGTPLQGVAYRDRTVDDVLAALPDSARKSVEYRYEEHGSDQPYPNGLPTSQVPGAWYVKDAAMGSDGQVILFVGPDLA